MGNFRYGLLNSDIEKITSVLKKYEEIEEVVIFGSRAKGNFKEYSDIDLTLLGESISQRMLFKIKIDLDLLNLPYIFDLSIKNKIDNPDLLDHINRVGILFYKKFPS
ncbi:nucleotidyltransferase domain-containing protein [Chryseobacterium sediminis]|uniref:nucleotidyltransferase domain-containing protein n=1 Tax=Chryseobacterium sediminis TaxID=1679494 RepID=UPI00286C81A5|nr:nucleotidyltransferase domain-containing protein [Chryseobacterium sediminis]